MASQKSTVIEPAPVAGNQFRLREKNETRIIPSQKFGMAMPTDESALIPASAVEPTRVAAATPSGTPMSSERTSA